jgi:pantetheine-phosphate adenylyltransferase
VKDFEYERDMADMNRQLSGVETVLLYSLPEYSAISSSVVRELKAYGRDVSEFLPKIP